MSQPIVLIPLEVIDKVLEVDYSRILNQERQVWGNIILEALMASLTRLLPWVYQLRETWGRSPSRDANPPYSQSAPSLPYPTYPLPPHLPTTSFSPPQKVTHVANLSKMRSHDTPTSTLVSSEIVHFSIIPLWANWGFGHRLYLPSHYSNQLTPDCWEQVTFDQRP